MKSLHEDEMFSALENRLREYTEQPDDAVWDNIAGAMAPLRESARIRWARRTGNALSVAILLLAMVPFVDKRGMSSSLAHLPSPVVAVDESKREELAIQAVQPELPGDDAVAEAADAKPASGENRVARSPASGSQSSPSLTETRGVHGRQSAETLSSSKPEKGTLEAHGARAKGSASLNGRTTAAKAGKAERLPQPERIHDASGGDATSASSGSAAPQALVATRGSAGSAKAKNGSAASTNDRKETRRAEGTTPTAPDSDAAKPDAVNKNEETAFSRVDDGAKGASSVVLQPEGAAESRPDARAGEAVATQRSEYFRANAASAVDSVLQENAKSDTVVVKNLVPKEEQPAKNPRKRKTLQLYGSVTPSLSYWHVTPQADDAVVVNGLVTRSIFSGERLGLSVEGGIQGSLSKKLEYFAGLQVYYQRQTLLYEYQSKDRVAVESNEGLDYIVRPVKQTGETPYKMLNMGVQSGVMYTLKKAKLSHKIGVGMSYQRGLLQNDGESYDNAGSSYLAYQLFYRNEYAIDKSLRIFFQPSFSRVFHSTEKLDEPFSLKTSRAGFSFGLVYQFGRRR